MNNINLNKRVFTLLLTAIVIASTVLTILPINLSAKAAPVASNWVFVLKDTLNQTIAANSATAELWNYTFNGGWTKKNKVAGPITVGSGGMVVMSLPAMLNASQTSGTQIHYVLVVKWKPGGVSTPFLLLNRTVTYLTYNATPAMIGAVGGGWLLNRTAAIGNINPSVDNTLFGPQATYPVYWVWLGRAIVHPVDWWGFPLTGASVQMILNATDKSTTSFVKMVNGTLGSELTGSVPYSTPNDAVGWAVFDAPVTDTRTDPTGWSGFDTNLNNATFIIRWKPNPATPLDAPVVGKFSTVFTMPGVPDTIGPDVPVDATLGTGTLLQTDINNRIFATCQVDWSLVYMEDIDTNPWYTEQAKLKAKAMKLDGSDFYQTYPYIGARIGPGLYMMRFPYSIDSDDYDFNLAWDVQWYSSVVFTEVNPGGEDPWSWSGYYSGTLGGFDGLDVFGLRCNMTHTIVWLTTSTEVPEWVQNPWAAEILLPAETAGSSGPGAIYTTIDWTSNLGQLVLPDSDALRYVMDPYSIANDLWGWWGGDDYYWIVRQHWPGPGQENSMWRGISLPTLYDGWLPVSDVGETNVRVWYKGIKVLDTTADLPSGVSPISLVYPDDYADWPIPAPDQGVWYNLAIYETGFILKFKVDNTTSLVPSYAPFFFTDAKGELIGPVGSSSGVYEIADAPLGNFSNFFILWKGSALYASNIKSIYVNQNLPNNVLLFNVCNLDIIPWSQEPFMISGVNFSLFFKVDFSALGIPQYKLDSVLHSSEFIKAFLPPGKAKYTVLSTSPLVWWVELKPDWPFGVAGLVDFLSSWDNSTGAPRQVVKYTLLPARTYDVRAFTVNGTALNQKPEYYGFRVGDKNVTLYWSQDKYPGVGPIVLTATKVLDLQTYVYNPFVALKDATGKPLVISPTTWPENETSAIFLSDKFLNPEPNNYTMRYNSTDSLGQAKFFSWNATGDDWALGSRFMIGGQKYKFTVYYKGVLVFNGSTTLTNPYVAKIHPLITSVYPYTFKATNNPLEGGSIFGIANLNITVTWGGLTTSLWSDEDLVVGDSAVMVYSLVNVTKLEKSFNLTAVNALGDASVLAVRGITNAAGEFTTLIPVWNYSNARTIYAALEYWHSASSHWHLLKLDSSGNVKPVEASTTWWTKVLPMFGTPVFANYTTIPGQTAGVPAEDEPRLAGAWFNTVDDDIDVFPGESRWFDDRYDYTIHAINATGLMNTASYTSDNATITELSLSTATTPAPGLLPGGVIQSPLVTKVAAYDIGVEVVDYFWNHLARQYVEVIRAEIEVDDTVIPSVLEMADYTPMTRPYYPLMLRSTPTKIFWGFYDYTVATTNCTKVPLDTVRSKGISLLEITEKIRNENATLTTDEKSIFSGSLFSIWELYGNQWLIDHLWGGDVDWDLEDSSVMLRWPAKLQIIVHAGDATRLLKGAWVTVVDAETGANVTTVITDEDGYAGSLEDSDAWGPLMTADGKRLNLGLNLLGGWNWYPDDDGHYQYMNDYEGPDSGVYIVRIFYKYGNDKITSSQFSVQAIDGASVWDTFRDQPQHRFIYLGVEPPTEATGEDWRSAQERTINTKVWDIRVVVKDQTSASGPVSGATVKIKPFGKPPYGIPTTGLSTDSSSTGEATWALVPAGTYDVEVTTSSKYGTSTTDTARVVMEGAPADVQIAASIYDAVIKLVSPSGKPIVNADVSLAGVDLGMTGATGEVLAPQIPAGSYTVVAKWQGQDISPTQPVAVKGTRTYLVTASKIFNLQVRVVGSQEQGLAGAHVDVKLGGTSVYSGVADADGVVAMELPSATYTVTGTYKGMSASQDVSLTADTVTTLRTAVFMEFFGASMTFSTFILWIVMAIIVVIVLIIVAQEYNIYRRKKLPQLFGPAAPK